MRFARCVWGPMRKLVGQQGAGEESWSGVGGARMAHLHWSLQGTSSPGLSQGHGVGSAL